MDAAYILAGLAPSHALHGGAEEVPIAVGKRIKCACSADLTFSPMQVATLLLFDEPKTGKAKKEVTDEP